MGFLLLWGGGACTRGTEAEGRRGQPGSCVRGGFFQGLPFLSLGMTKLGMDYLLLGPKILWETIVAKCQNVPKPVFEAQLSAKSQTETEDVICFI